MKAFNNDESLKNLLVDKMNNHYINNEISQGKYNIHYVPGGFHTFEFHHSDNFYFEKIGLTDWLDKLTESIFFSLEENEAKLFARDFFKKINTGANLENIKKKVLIFICELLLDRVQGPKYIEHKRRINNVIFELKKKNIDRKKLKEARGKVYTLDAGSAPAFAAACAADGVFLYSPKPIIKAFYISVSDSDGSLSTKKTKIFADKLFELMENEK